MKCVQDLLSSAWKLSQSGIPSTVCISLCSNPSLLELWSSARALSRGWWRQLPDPERCLFSEVGDDWTQTAYQVLTTDLVMRVYGTVLCSRTSQSPQPSPRPILDHVIQHIAYPRGRVNDLLLQGGEHQSALEIYRRRCERWTDLLIGPWIVTSGYSAYAYDPRRAWDYGEDTVMSPNSAWADALLAPSYRSAFAGPAGEIPLRGDGWSAICQQLDLATGGDNHTHPETDPFANVATSPEIAASRTLDSAVAPTRKLGAFEDSLRKLLSKARLPEDEDFQSRAG
ncbi:hypothetical protein GC163_05740 [bacterium]|nr:hypothetical protein [bacterium]